MRSVAKGRDNWWCEAKRSGSLIAPSARKSVSAGKGRRVAGVVEDASGVGMQEISFRIVGVGDGNRSGRYVCMYLTSIITSLRRSGPGALRNSNNT